MENEVKQKAPAKPQKKVALSAELAAFIGAPEASRPEVTKALWVHIKANKLQDPENGQYVLPDATLAPLIGAERVHMTQMTKPLAKHFPKA